MPMAFFLGLNELPWYIYKNHFEVLVESSKISKRSIAVLHFFFKDFLNEYLSIEDITGTAQIKI